MSKEEREAFALAVRWVEADPNIPDKALTEREALLMRLAIRCMWNPGIVHLRTAELRGGLPCLPSEDPLRSLPVNPDRAAEL